MTFQRRPSSSSSVLLLCFHLLVAPLLWYFCGTFAEAALGSSSLQALNCSTSGNYTAMDAYAANVNQLLGVLPENAVTKNGGFFNGTVGLGRDTVYGLAMCPADYSRADCGDCLAAAAASDANGLPNRCPGSRTVLAMFDRCLVRYSDANFFDTPDTGAVSTSASGSIAGSKSDYTKKVAYSLSEATSAANISPQRFAASVGIPYVFVQCTWDLPADKCRECLDALSSNATEFWFLKVEGQQKSYSCTVRYSNTSFMVVPFTPASATATQSVNQTQTGTSAPPSSPSGSSRAVTVVGVVIAVVVVACLVASLLYVQKLRRQRTLPKPADIQQVSANCFVRSSGHDGKFTYQQLEEATHQFADDEKLGEGSFGAVYKGRLEVDGVNMYVAVKRITNTVLERARDDFKNEIKIMKRVNHRNIINLLGSCDEGDNLFLVYELMNNGNLEEKLYPKEATIDARVYCATDLGTTLQLDWNNRRNILIGIGAGLEYLHSGCKKRVLHRDIKPSNVMLDNDLNAKLCDFGLVTQVEHTQTSRLTDTVCGTRAYMDPEYIRTGKVTDQSDVYSFGIVLLELVCGVRPSLENGTTNILVEKVRAYNERNEILEAADRRLRGRAEENIKRALMIGLLCVQPEPRHRPPIIEVNGFLRKTNAPLPPLASRNGNRTEYSTCFSSLPRRSSRNDEETGSKALLQERPT